MRWLVLTQAAADAAEQQCWLAYYAARLAEEGRAPGQPIDTYYADPRGAGVPAPVAITTAYCRAARAGGQAALPVDDFVRSVLRHDVASEVDEDALPAALRDRVRPDERAGVRP